MAQAVKGSVKRSYVSTKRREQALATRSAVVEAALRLFTTDGYAATTIQAIAHQAGVAVPTVYSVFGTKRELLREALEAAVSGNAAALPLAEHPEAAALAQERDPRRRAAMDAAMVAKVTPRIVPLVRVLREAARVDPDFAPTAAAITAQRRADMVAAVRVLGGDVGVHMPLEDAVGTLYTLYSPDVFTALTEDLGWSAKRYQRWVATMLYRTLLAPDLDGD